MIKKLSRTLSGSTDIGSFTSSSMTDIDTLDNTSGNALMPCFENFQELPDELVLNIFQFLNRKFIILKIELVNKRFHRLARNEHLWWNLTFCKRGRSEMILDPTVRIFEKNPSCEYFPVYKLNCRDYYMEKILVKRSCNTLTNKMLSQSTPSTPGDSSPTTLKRKLMMSWKPIVSTESQMLFVHDRQFEKRMKIAQENSSRFGHYNPHARHRHTITCTSPDESSFVMIGGFKYANNITVPANANDDNEIDDADVVHEFDTTTAHFQQVRIRTPTSPLSPGTFDHFAFSNSANTSGAPSSGSHTRTNSLSGKPLQFGKHSCVCIDNKRLLLFGGTEGENTVVTNNLYIYNLHTKEWIQKEFAPDALQPSPRTNHQAALVVGPSGKREMYVVGGGVGQEMTPTDEIWALDVGNYTWRRVDVKLKKGQKTCPFTPRLGFTMHELNNKLIVYGGGYWHQNGQEKKWKEYYRELFVFDVKTSTWTNIDMSHCIDHVPKSGTFPVSCRVGAHLFVVGGGIVWDVSSEVNVLDLVTFKWRKVTSEQSYAADSSACITLKDYSEDPRYPKTKILLFGGYRYKPLSEYKVFSVKWKDYMTERGRNSVERMEPETSDISAAS
jgi:hypothetical protein